MDNLDAFIGYLLAELRRIQSPTGAEKPIYPSQLIEAIETAADLVRGDPDA